MSEAFARSLVSALGLAFAGLGALGLLLSGSQLLAWLLGNARPVVAPVWQHNGLIGELLVALFTWLPAVLAAAAVFHGCVAWLGFGLYRRRGWAHTGMSVLACGWAGFALAGWLLARVALADFAAANPGQRPFADAAALLAAQVAAVSVLLAALLLLLLRQPLVRRQFSAGSAGTSTSNAGRARAA